MNFPMILKATSIALAERAALEQQEKRLDSLVIGMSTPSSASKNI